MIVCVCECVCKAQSSFSRHMVIHAPLVLKRKVFGSTSLVPLTLEVR